MGRLMTWQPLILSVDLFEYQKKFETARNTEIKIMDGYSWVSKNSYFNLYVIFLALTIKYFHRFLITLNTISFLEFNDYTSNLKYVLFSRFLDKI